MDALVRLDEVTKRYDGDAAPAVDGVSVQIAPGEAVAVMDPSGSGRSALLNMIAGLDRATTGTVTVAGERIDRHDVRDTWCEALFASWLQPSDAPTAETVAEAVAFAIGHFGIRGCVGRMAQEFGDHPDAAAERMRWVRRLAAETWSAAA
jgi:ABC-type multidrug transport system ATPase subunit